MSKYTDNYKRSRYSEPAQSGGEAAGRVLGIVLAILTIGLIAMLAWNIGVVGIVAASGGHVAKIGYFTALFAWIALLLLVGVVRRVRQ